MERAKRYAIAKYSMLSPEAFVELHGYDAKREFVTLASAYDALYAENERLEKKNSLALDALKKADAMHDGITLSNEVWDVEQTIGDLRKDYDRARALVEEET